MQMIFFRNRLKFFLDRSFAQQMIEMGLTPSSEILRINRKFIDETSPASLHRKMGSNSLELFRLRFGDDTPIGVQYTTIITDACPELGDEDFEKESLYRLRNAMTSAGQTEEQPAATPLEQHSG